MHMRIKLGVPRYRQPHLECGPTALKQVMEFLAPKKTYDIRKLIKETASELKYLDWNYKLGTSAIRHGFKAAIYSANSDMYDPTWKNLPTRKLISKLERRLYFVQHAKKSDVRAGYVWWWYNSSLEAALEFLRAGGIVKLCPISKELLMDILKHGTPVLAPINGSLAYGLKRVYFGKYNDIRGEYFGHFFTVSGYDGKKFIITDTEKLSDKTGGIRRIDGNLLLNAILTHNAEVLAVY